MLFQSGFRLAGNLLGGKYPPDISSKYGFYFETDMRWERLVLCLPRLARLVSLQMNAGEAQQRTGLSDAIPLVRRSPIT
jgi:hypothetical protein